MNIRMGAPVSKRNRERREMARKWACPGCGARFDAALGEKAEGLNCRSGPGPRCVHSCGECGAMAYAEADCLRLVTPAERFALEVENPQVVRTAEFLTATNAPSTVVFRGKRDPG